MSEWDLNDFKEPRDKKILTPQSKKGRPGKNGRQAAKQNNDRIIVYMKSEEESEYRKEAEELGVSASTLINMKLKRLKKLEG